MKSSTLTGLTYTGAACALTTLAIAIGNGNLSAHFTDPLGEAGCFITLLFFAVLLLWKACTAYTDRSTDDEGPLGI